MGVHRNAPLHGSVRRPTRRIPHPAAEASCYGDRRCAARRRPESCFRKPWPRQRRGRRTLQYSKSWKGNVKLYKDTHTYKTLPNYLCISMHIKTTLADTTTGTRRPAHVHIVLWTQHSLLLPRITLVVHGIILLCQPVYAICALHCMHACTCLSTLGCRSWGSFP